MKQVAASAGRRQSTCEADKYWGGPTKGHDQDTNYLADKRRGIPPRDNEIPRQMLRNPQLCFQPPLKMNLSRQWQVQIKRTLTTEGQRQGHFNDARQGKHRLDNRQGHNDKKSADPATEEYRHGGKWHSATSKWAGDECRVWSPTDPGITPMRAPTPDLGITSMIHATIV